MQSTSNKILTHIKKCGRGKLFFPSDFMRLGDPRNVQKSFENLAKDGVIIRVARGIYCYPKIDKKFGLGILYPSLEDIAYTIAKRDKARIAPTGDYALNRLGLSTQVPTNVVFYTDGSPRKIKVYDNKHITFRNVAPKKLAFKNDINMLIVFALQEIACENFNSYHFLRVREILQNVPQQVILEDASLIPIWIRNIIDKCYE